MPPPDPISISRYHRQTLLPDQSEHTQSLLASSHAAIVGLGALGTVAADLLARAGVGTLTLIDRDLVELTNLQRQTLYTEADARNALPKPVAAANRLVEVNSEITLRPITTHLSPRNAESIVAPADVILDCTDNFAARYLLSDVAVKTRTPLCYAGAISTRAMVITLIPPASPCLRCIFPDQPATTTDTCDTVGVLPTASTAAAALQATNALKLLTKNHHRIPSTITEIDPWHNTLRTINLHTTDRAHCPACATAAFPSLDPTAHDATLSLCGSASTPAYQIAPPAAGSIDLPSLAHRLAPLGSFTLTPFLLRGSLDTPPCELTIFPDARAIIKGPDSPDLARSIYNRFVSA